MRTRMGQVMVLSAATVLLVACGDREAGPLAPAASGVQANVRQMATSCGGVLQSREQRASFGTLPLVTVTATFGGSFGVPVNLFQQMNFSFADASMVPCLNTDDVAYSVREATEEDTLEVDYPVPDGVAPGDWSSLSPRERAKLWKVAELIFDVAPSYYGSVSGVISQRLMPSLVEAKVKAKKRALDFLTGPRAELLAGGIYGCELYQRLVSDRNWVLLRGETLQFTADLAAAFGETLYETRPLSGLVFAKNGAYGADIASRAGTLPLDCGWAVFGASGSGRIVTEDPYAPRPVPPPTKPFVPDGGGQWDH